MRRSTAFHLFAALLLPIAGCGDPPAAGSGVKPAAPADDGPGHVHQDRQDLGEVAIGSHRIHVFQVVDITPGKDGDFDLDFAVGAVLPTVRGWIGAESGVGSMKIRFDKETDVRMHGHPPVPDPLGNAAQLWLDVEGVGKAAVALRR